MQAARGAFAGIRPPPSRPPLDMVSNARIHPVHGAIMAVLSVLRARERLLAQAQPPAVDTTTKTCEGRAQALGSRSLFPSFTNMGTTTTPSPGPIRRHEKSALVFDLTDDEQP